MLFLLDKIQSQKTLIQKLEFTSIKLQQEIKTLEILRDKQKISFEMELSKKEKKEMDAFGTRAYVSKSNLWESEDLD
jgi:flagellar biosynthesis chaperone FliJ